MYKIVAAGLRSIASDATRPGRRARPHPGTHKTQLEPVCMAAYLLLIAARFALRKSMLLRKLRAISFRTRSTVAIQQSQGCYRGQNCMARRLRCCGQSIHRLPRRLSHTTGTVGAHGEIKITSKSCPCDGGSLRSLLVQSYIYNLHLNQPIFHTK